MGEFPSGTARHLSVLVIESHPKALALLERYLLLGGAMTVRTAKSALDGLHVLQDRRTPVDCVVCGHDIEPMTGLAFLQMLRAGRYGSGPSVRAVPFVPVMFRGNAAVQRAAEAADAHNVLDYPFDRDELTAAVHSAVAAPPAAERSASAGPTERDWTQRFHVDGIDRASGYVDHFASSDGRGAGKYVARAPGGSAEFQSLKQAEAWLRQRLKARG